MYLLVGRVDMDVPGQPFQLINQATEFIDMSALPRKAVPHSSLSSAARPLVWQPCAMGSLSEQLALQTEKSHCM